MLLRLFSQYFYKIAKTLAYIGSGVVVCIIGLSIFFLVDIAYTSLLKYIYNSKTLFSPVLTDRYSWFVIFTRKTLSRTNLLFFILGIYLTSLSIFFNFCEIFYIVNNSKKKLEDVVLTSAIESIKNTGAIIFNTIMVPIGFVFFVFFILGGRGCNRIEVSFFSHQNKDLINHGVIVFFKQALLFHFKVISFVLLNTVALVILLFSPVIIIRIFWTFGFWTSIGFLVFISKQLAAFLHLPILAPIFSILLGLIGIVISFVGFLI